MGCGGRQRARHNRTPTEIRFPETDRQKAAKSISAPPDKNGDTTTAVAAAQRLSPATIKAARINTHAHCLY